MPLFLSLILALLHLQDEGVGGGRRGEDEEPATRHQPLDLRIQPRLGLSDFTQSRPLERPSGARVPRSYETTPSPKTDIWP